MLNKIKYFFSIISLCLVLFSSLGQANQNIDLFNKANELYVKNKFKPAIKVYEELLDTFPENADIHYNLGNAYSQFDNYGKSIFHYKKALINSPRDPDLRANYQFIESKRESSQIEKSLIYKINHMIYFWSGYLTKGEIILFGFSFFLLGNILWTIKIIKRGKSKIILAVLFISIYISGAFIFKDFLYDERIAIVINDTIEVMPNFIQTEKSIFQLKSGDEIEVLSIQKVSHDKKWCQILLPNSKKGWIPINQIKFL